MKDVFADIKNDEFIRIKCDFERLSDKDNAEKMSKYMRYKFKFYGIKSPERKSIYKDFLKSEKAMLKSSADIAWDFLRRCYLEKKREFHYFVIDYLNYVREFLTFDDIENLRFFVDNNQWWDSIDGLHGIFGFLSLKDSRVDEVMLTWSVDEDFWVRRIAIDHQLGLKEKTDVDLLEKIIVNNFGSDEFFINKAIGWSLREYSKTDSAWVRDFVSRYEDNMSKLSVREALKHIIYQYKRR